MAQAGLFSARCAPSDGIALRVASQVISMRLGAVWYARAFARVAIFEAGSVCRTLA